MRYGILIVFFMASALFPVQAQGPHKFNYLSILGEPNFSKQTHFQVGAGIEFNQFYGTCTYSKLKSAGLYLGQLHTSDFGASLRYKYSPIWLPFNPAKLYFSAALNTPFKNKNYWLSFTPAAGFQMLTAGKNYRFIQLDFWAGYEIPVYQKVENKNGSGICFGLRTGIAWIKK